MRIPRWGSRLAAGIFLLAASAVSAQDAGRSREAGGIGSTGKAARGPAKIVTVDWPAGKGVTGRMELDMAADRPLLRRVGLVKEGKWSEVLRNADPAFLLRVGTRDLVSQNGWNIFFDKVPKKPYSSYAVQMVKDGIRVIHRGARTIIRVGKMMAGEVFNGWLEITLYDGAALFNIAAVMRTERDSTALLYDAGLVSRERIWDNIRFYGVDDVLRSQPARMEDDVRHQAVKYRMIAGETERGGLAVFPGPHQYFYPLDEAFNLQFTWYGRYGSWPYGIGIRQDPEGDHRYVPWVNAPPGTLQRCNFFCLMGSGGAASVLDGVRAYTHDDAYVRLPGYKTLSSHFHNEFISKVVLAGKPVPERPAFVDVFRRAGVDMVHLAEFHGVGHPRGPDTLRLRELHALFEQCRRLSDTGFLLMPGEEPNEFFGGHWLAFFRRPVYWVMSRGAGTAFEGNDPVYGKVYHVGDAEEMLKLLEAERGLAWTAHPRTKGSTGYPDTYKEKPFFLSDRWLGGAWKALPSDLSQPGLGRRALDLLDDMNNWGVHKQVLAEADLFTIEPENEMYAHMDVNYLRMDRIPGFDEGWGAVLDTLRNGSFFSTTGEVLIPSFAMSGGRVNFSLSWTFPMHFAEIVSGDGVKVYRHRIDLDDTKPFGKRDFHVRLDLSGRKWVRVEAWDAAANGAFTQTAWLGSDGQGR